MSAFLMLKLLSAVVSIALAAALLARDHGLKANRLLAAFLSCNAYWAVVEFFLYQATEAESAARLYRAMGLGWIPMGLLCAHASVTLSAIGRHPVTRLIPGCYAALAVVVPLSLFSDMVIAGAEPIASGWRPVFGSGMTLAYGLVAMPLVAVLASWRTLLGIADADGQRLLARIVFFGISGALAAGTCTAVILPLLKLQSVGITTTLVAVVGLGVAATLWRFGHSLIAPEAFSREILDTLDDGVVLVGNDGALRDANRAFLRMIGEPGWAAMGRPMTDWIPRFSDRLESLEEASLFEMHTRAGISLPVVLSAPTKCHGAGRLIGHAYLVRDRREIVSLQRQLIVSARLAAVGDLSKSISAAINEPIGRVREELTGLDLDWQSLGDAIELADRQAVCKEAIDEGGELIDECVEGVDRVFEISREVAGFSGEREQDDYVRHDLAQIVRRAIRIASVQAPEDLEIEARLDPDVAVLCHFSELERVVTNLLVNAIHALDAKPPGTRHLVVAVAAQAGRALLHVEDDGCGIATEVLDRIFDPFFTTKPVGKGTGLGLAISYHIVKAHGGEIRVSSVPDRGTSVAVELPRALR